MKRVALLAALQVAAILGWAGQQEAVRASAPAFRIPLAPVDPYDVLRGRYFILNPRDGSLYTAEPGCPLAAAEAERFAGGPAATYYGAAEVGFCPDGELWRVCRLRRPGEPQPAGDAAQFWSRADLRLDHHESLWREGEKVDEPGWFLVVDLGLERFFLPNRLHLPAAERADGWELEVAHRPGQTPLPLRLLFRGKPVWPR